MKKKCVGFWLGFILLFLVACKPTPMFNDNKENSQDSTTETYLDIPSTNRQLNLMCRKGLKNFLTNHRILNSTKLAHSVNIGMLFMTIIIGCLIWDIIQILVPVVCLIGKNC